MDSQQEFIPVLSIFLLSLKSLQMIHKFLHYSPHIYQNEK